MSLSLVRDPVEDSLDECTTLMVQGIEELEELYGIDSFHAEFGRMSI